MTEPVDLAHIEAAFHELDALPPAQRAARLDALAVSEPALHRELIALFQASTGLTRREAEIEGMADLSRQVLGQRGREPEQIGPYRLIRLLGEGGMGRVYEADQSEPVQRRVALKLMRRGLDSREAEARFRAERQALAVLDHPHIAKVFEAGSDDEGRPWFAMELVPGQPITRFAESRGLDLRQRIELLLPVCEAVQHAHLKGVIHRDLKPSNILVIEDAGRAQPKVIDFGIAKIGEASLEGRSFATQAGELLGTPEYMSPEQASLGEQDIDTRADVYALGLVLYELLVGELPLSGVELRRAGFLEMCRRIREEDTPRPSSHLPRTDTGSPSSWQHALRGELDAVLLKALAKDRERRYDSVAGFADDLRRYLADQPVMAAPPSLGYRLGKFVRRNRAAVAATVIVALALVAGTVVAGLGLLEARRAEAWALQSASLAERERATAVAVTKFVVDLFRASDPRRNPGLDLTARELLQRGQERIAEMVEQPEVQAQLLLSLGDVHWTLGANDEAESLLRQARALRQQGPAADPLEQVFVNNRLAGLLRDRGDYPEAELLYREALALLQQAGRLESAEEVTVLNNFGIVLNHIGELDEADAVYRRAIALIERLSAEDPEAHSGWSSNIANLWVNLASVNNSRGRHAEAEQATLGALAIYAGSLPANHPNLAVLNNNLGHFAAAQGDLGRAIAYAREAVAINQEALPADHPRAASHRLNLGRFLVRAGALEAARGELQGALDVFRAKLGADSYDTTRPLGWLGVAAFADGDLESAQRFTKEAITLIRASGHPAAERDLPVVLRRLALIEARLGRWAEAGLVAREALELTAERDEERAVALLILALISRETGDAAAAEAHFAAAQALCESDAPCALDRGEELLLRAQWWLRTGELEQALPLLERALEHPGWTAWMFQGPDFEALTDDGRVRALQAQLAARGAAAYGTLPTPLQ